MALKNQAPLMVELKSSMRVTHVKCMLGKAALMTSFCRWKMRAKSVGALHCRHCPARRTSSIICAASSRRATASAPQHKRNEAKSGRKGAQQGKGAAQGEKGSTRAAEAAHGHRNSARSATGSGPSLLKFETVKRQGAQMLEKQAIQDRA
jgi:hypothetical protein